MRFRMFAPVSGVGFVMAVTLIMAGMVTLFFFHMADAEQHTTTSGGRLIAFYGLPLTVWLAVLAWARYIDKSRQAMEKMESFNASIIEVSTEAIIVIDQRGLVTLFSPAAERLFGYSSHEIIGRNISLLMPEPLASQHDAYLERYLTTGEQHIIGAGRIVVAVDKLGRRITVRLSVGEFKQDNQRFFVGMVSDYSERIEVERKLGQFAQAADANPDLVYITDARGLIVYVNPAFTVLTGLTLEETQGREPSLIDHPETNRETLANMAKTLQRGEAWRGRLRIIHKHTAQESARWLDMSMAPIRDDRGKLSGFVSLGRDVTDKILLEQSEALQRESAELRVKIGEILHAQEPLQARLTRALSLLLSMAGLVLQNKGGIFLRTHDEEPARLRMFLTQGEFSAEFLEKEDCIKLGSCLCGRVALSGELLISDDCFCDPRHEHRFIGMQPHGHYIVPLSDARNTLGVLFLYTDPYPKPDSSRLEMLRLVGQMMGLAIANDLLHKRICDARDAAMEAIRTKSHFLANISHEIRTPMNGLLGTLELLQDTSLGQHQNELLKIGYNAARELRDTLNDLLDFSGLESGKLTVEQREFDLYQVITGVRASFETRAEEQGLQFFCEITPDLPMQVKGDPGRLRQVLTNLLDNAVKFTPRGKVTLRVKVQPLADGKMHLAVEVGDTGIGIDPALQAKLFEGFVQADGSSTRNHGGTGLGLTLCRELITLMGGDISVESQPGAGSTFRFNLTLEAVTQRPAHPELKIAAPATYPSFHGHILLVEDNAANQMVAKGLLSRHGLSVDVACDGMEALARIAASPYDLVLMDCQMPVMDGYTATRELRRRETAEGWQHLPVIAMTANAMAGDRERCLESGMDDYLAKPMNRAVLLEILKHWLQAGPDIQLRETESTDAPPIESVLTELAETPSEPPIQPEALEDLRRLMGAAFPELVDTFLENTPQLIDDLRTGIATGDLKKQYEAMHSLKSSSALLGARKLSGLAAEFEKQARMQEPVASNQLDLLCLEFEGVRLSLEAVRE